MAKQNTMQVAEKAALERSTQGTVLIVDDSRLQRRILLSSIRKWGYDVVEAESGDDALELCKSRHFDMILSDWMMPGMTGPEFCSAFRALSSDTFTYFILLTSKSEKDEIAHGLEVGADDFLIKPVHAGELRARMSAGQRIIEMHGQLSEKNALISQTLTEIQTLYASIEKDLEEAKKLQQSLIPKRYQDFHTCQASLLLRSSGHVGGDLVGVFPVNENSIGLFSIDVSGHGISSALMTARLAGYLSAANPEQNIAIMRDFDGTQFPQSPDYVVGELNRLMFEELETEHYFTIVLAMLDLTTGHLVGCQAGHPHPVVARATGEYELIGDGGLPVGLIPDATFTSFESEIRPGDRLLLGSDGMTECEDPNGMQLEDEGLIDLMRKNDQLAGVSYLEGLVGDLTVFAETNDFADDVSALLLEFQRNVAD